MHALHALDRGLVLSQSEVRFAILRRGGRVRRAVRGHHVCLESLEVRALLSSSPSGLPSQVQINSTTDFTDDITLYNATGELKASQQIPVTIKNIGTKAGAFTLSVQKVGSGNVTLSTTKTPTLAPQGTFTFMVTPTAVSSAVNDVHIIATNGGVKCTGRVTVVSVQIPQKVYDPDTPKALLDQGAFRISKGDSRQTSVDVTITPTLGSGQKVTLEIDGDSAEHGTVSIAGDGNSHDMTQSATLQLKGLTQTAVTNGIKLSDKGQVLNPGASNSNAGQLHLAVFVHGAKAIQSAGFSVAVIPNQVSLGTQQNTSPPFGFGFTAQMIVGADSGDIHDLDQSGIGELVEVGAPELGYYLNNGGQNAANSNGKFYGPASSRPFKDQHTSSLATITIQGDQNGYQLTNQLYQFSDNRLGISGVAIDHSGFQITKAFNRQGNFSSLVLKQGVGVTVLGLTTTAGVGGPMQQPIGNQDSLPGSPFAPFAGDSSTNSQLAASQLALTGPSGNILTGASFDVMAFARDASGNIDTSFSGPITLALTGNPGNANLGGVLVVNAVQGQATFTGLTINQPGDGYVLRALSSALAGANSASFNVTNTQLVVTTQPPASIETDSTFGLVVTAKDRFGNVDPSFNGLVTLLDGLGQALGGVSSVQAIQGVATFTGLSLTHTAQLDSLTATASGAAPAVTNSFDVEATATRFTILQPPPGAVTVGSNFGLQIAAVDAFGNIDADYTGSVSLAFVSNPGGQALGGTSSVNAVGGVATFASVKINAAGNGYTLQATGGGLQAVTTDPFNAKAAGKATKLVFTTSPPGSTTAGSTFQVVVKAEDDQGTVDTTFAGLVTLTDADGNQVGQVAAVTGVATFNSVAENSARDDVLEAASGTLTVATSNVIHVAATAATHWVLYAPFGVVQKGVGFSVFAYAADAQGNLNTSVSGTLSLSLLANPGGATLGGTLTATVVNGIARFNNLTLNQAGIGYSLQVTGISLTAGVSATFNVVADRLALAAPFPGSVTQNQSFTVGVNALASGGAVDSAFTGNVTVSLIDFGATGAVLSGTLTRTSVAGQATFTGLSIDKVGDFELLFTNTTTGATRTTLFSSLTLNHAPTFAAGPNQTWLQGAGAQSIAHWATDLTDGPGDGENQRLNFLITNDNNSLFAVPPTISPDGTLSFTPANASGVATVSVRLQDDGGTQGGGVDTSSIQTFTITINSPSNHIPTFKKGKNIAVVGSTPFSALWAKSITGGKGDVGQTLNFLVTNDNTSLFLVQPAISPSGQLTFTPAAGMSGKATLSVRLHDSGGTFNGGVDTSAIVTFTITVSQPAAPIALPTIANKDSGVRDGFDTTKTSVSLWSPIAAVKSRWSELRRREK